MRGDCGAAHPEGGDPARTRRMAPAYIQAAPRAGRSGVISDPPPTPVIPTSAPTQNPESITAGASLPRPLSKVENPGFPRGCARLAVLRPKPPVGGISCAASPARNSRPSR